MSAESRLFVLLGAAALVVAGAVVGLVTSPPTAEVVITADRDDDRDDDEPDEQSDPEGEGGELAEEPPAPDDSPSETDPDESEPDASGPVLNTDAESACGDRFGPKTQDEEANFPATELRDGGAIYHYGPLTDYDVPYDIPLVMVLHEEGGGPVTARERSGWCGLDSPVHHRLPGRLPDPVGL